MQQLPKYFVIKWDGDNPLWQLYIDWLNKEYEKDGDGGVVDGTNTEAYYGYDGIRNGHTEYYLFRHSPYIITLEQWNEAIN